jgi:tetratricopeptide (TPR) repeat protein
MVATVSNRVVQRRSGARTTFRPLEISFKLLQIVIVAALSLLASEALWAQQSGQSIGQEQEKASIEVHLQLADGSQFDGVARVRILSLSGLEVGESGVAGTSQTSISEIERGSYIVEASAPGFITVQEPVNVYLKAGFVTVFLTLRSASSEKSESDANAAPILAPAARKELQKGVEEFRQSHLQEARKHFERVLVLAPSNPDIHFLMGALEAQEKNTAAAEGQLEKAIQLYPDHAPSLELLGSMYCQQGDLQKGVPLLEKAASIEDGSWKVHWKLGSAYLRMNEPEKARRQADRAIDLGKGAAGQAQILYARVLVHLNQWDDAEAFLKVFLHDQPNDPAAAEARAFLIQLQKRQQDESNKLPLPLNGAADLSAIASLSPRNVASKNSAWFKPGVDDVVPTVSPNVSCSLPDVLNGAGKRVEQLMANLEKFSAKEQVKHFPVDRNGEMRSPDTRSFEYIAFVSQKPHSVIYLEEFRNGSLDRNLFPAGIATEGLPAMALIFHPQMSSDFNFVCEGLGQTNGRPAWQIHFQQRPDRAGRIRGYVVASTLYPMALKGRAWIDAGTYQVSRLESEMVSPIPQIDLLQEHLSIEYAPVQFHTANLQFWLPHSAELFVERSKGAFYRTHTFSKFQVFNVSMDQKLLAPKESYSFTNLSDREVIGQLTITPLPERSLNPITITFTIPPRDMVSKLVGPGKDLDIPADSIDSARFVYSGAVGMVTVSASLSRTSTLEIAPEMQSPVGPQD